MKFNIIVLLFLLMFTACQTPSTETGGESIDDLLMALKTDLDAEKSTLLITKIKQYVEQNPQDKDTNIRYLGAGLNNLTARMTDPKTGKMDKTIAMEFINFSDATSQLYPARAETPAMLQKAGEVARSIRAFKKAIEIYDTIYEKYPASKQAPQALFMKAFTYDNEMGEKEKAKELYTLFLEKYPNDDFADDTKFLLENLFKSNEEIIQEFGDEK